MKRLSADDGWLLLLAAARGGRGRRAGDKSRRRHPEDTGASAGEWAEVLTRLAWLVKGLPEDAMKPLYLCYDDLRPAVPPHQAVLPLLLCLLFPSDHAMDTGSGFILAHVILNAKQQSVPFVKCLGCLNDV